MSAIVNSPISCRPALTPVDTSNRPSEDIRWFDAGCPSIKAAAIATFTGLSAEQKNTLRIKDGAEEFLALLPAFFKDSAKLNQLISELEKVPRTAQDFPQVQALINYLRSQAITVITCDSSLKPEPDANKQLPKGSVWIDLGCGNIKTAFATAFDPVAKNEREPLRTLDAPKKFFAPRDGFLTNSGMLNVVITSLKAVTKEAPDYNQAQSLLDYLEPQQRALNDAATPAAANGRLAAVPLSAKKRNPVTPPRPELGPPPTVGTLTRSTAMTTGGALKDTSIVAVPREQRREDSGALARVLGEAPRATKSPAKNITITTPQAFDPVLKRIINESMADLPFTNDHKRILIQGKIKAGVFTPDFHVYTHSTYAQEDKDLQAQLNTAVRESVQQQVKFKFSEDHDVGPRTIGIALENEIDMSGE